MSDFILERGRYIFCIANESKEALIESSALAGIAAVFAANNRTAFTCFNHMKFYACKLHDVITTVNDSMPLCFSNRPILILIGTH